jgi:hypothetical protein
MQAVQTQLEIPNAIAYHVPYEDGLGTGCLVAQGQRHPNSTIGKRLFDWDHIHKRQRGERMHAISPQISKRSGSSNSAVLALVAYNKQSVGMLYDACVEDT